MTDKKTKKGFTLIEIVIVLAIAALIMVVVFLAVQGAQRNQRDQARKDAANRVAAAAISVRGNNNGTAPTQAQLESAVPAAERRIGSTQITIAVQTPPACSGNTGGTVVSVVAGTTDAATICLEAGQNYTAQ